MGGRTIKIIGIGNLLMGDDGVGIVAIERLREQDLSGDAELIDAGTGGLSLLYQMEGSDKVVFLDAVEMGKAPGTVRCFGGEDLAQGEHGHVGLSLHATGLIEVLALAREVGTVPEVVLIGVQPLSVERRLGLSSVVEGALCRLLCAVEKEIE